MTVAGPLFSFFGAKWRLRHAYPAPLHDTLVEPFAGSACYSLAYPAKRVILVEKDPVVAGVWRYLLGASVADILALPDVELGATTDTLTCCEEARALIGFWCAKARPRPAKTPSKWWRDYQGTSALLWGPRVRQRIARTLPLIRHWQLLEGDYTSAPDVDATWFVDPPYQREGWVYRCSSVRIDYAHLGEWTRSRRGQVIACESEGADWLPFRPLATTRSVRRKSVREVVWTRGGREQLSLEERIA